MTDRFKLRCLGSPALFTEAGEPVRFRTRKHLALLVRLAVDSGKHFTRDYLADLLWPDASPKLANHSLAQGLSVIKAKIAREAVVIQRATVGLAAGWVDVDTNFLAGGAVAIAGPFLDGFELPAARPFEDWKDEFRARLVPQLRDCLVRQMDAARRIGDYATVERHATKLQELDPLAEEGIRGVMEARAWASDRSSALKAFARYEAKLAEELGAKPGPDLIRMADLLRDGRRTPSRPAVAGDPPERADRRFEPETLIGREREFSVLYDAWTAARHKSPRIVVVTSDPGVGKTTLVNAFAASCQMDGAVVARAQAYDAERELPFAVLGELVKQLAMQRAIGSADPEALSELTRISSEILKVYPGVPKPVEWSPELMPLRIADALLKTITAASADDPVMIVVDDIHAADNASTAILHSLARKFVDTRVLLILAGRRSELRLSAAPWEFVNDSSIAGLSVLDLGVLGDSETRELINRVAGSSKKLDPPLERIANASGGNPLAIELLTREWCEPGASSLLRDLKALDTQPAPKIGIPRAIAVVFERQTTRLEPPVRAALDLAAVLGRRLTDVKLYSAIDLQPGPAAEALSRLHDDGYLREVRGELEFRNELIRAQAYYSLARSTRQHLHRRIAELLEQDLDIDQSLNLEIAWHHLRSGDHSKAVPYAIAGAESVLAVGVPNAAEEVLQAVLDRAPNGENAKKLKFLLVKALIDQSKASQAHPLLDNLAATVDLTLLESAELAMLRAGAEFLENRDRGSRYHDLAKQALDAARRTHDTDLIAHALFECARAGGEDGVPDLIQVAQSGIRELEATGNGKRPMIALAKAYCTFALRDPAAALRHLGRFMSSTSATPNAAQLCFIYSGIGISHYFLGHYQEAAEAYLQALALAQKIGDEHRVSTICSNLCTMSMHRGDYEESIRYGVISVRAGEASASSTLLVSYVNLMDPYFLTGQEGKAVECLEKARSWLGPERRWKLRCQFLIEAASLALSQRNLGLAMDLIAQVESLARNREDAIAMQGSYWKLVAFRKATMGYVEDARRLLMSLADAWKDTFVIHYLDVLAARAWLEMHFDGGMTLKTKQDLSVFDSLGARGKQALLRVQGFLPSAGSDQLAAASTDRAPSSSPTQPLMRTRQRVSHDPQNRS